MNLSGLTDNLSAFARLPWKLIGLALAVLLAGSYLLWTWYAPAPAISQAGYMQAAPAHAVASAGTVPVKVDAVQVIPKQVAAKKLKLPVEIAEDEGKQVVATAEIPPTKGGATAVTVLDTRTGHSETLIKETPRSLVSFERGTEVGARYGVTTDGGTSLAVYARRDLLRVGSVYLAGYAEASIAGDGDSEAKAMIDVSMRW